MTQVSYADSKRLNKILEGTGLQGLGKFYVQAEKKYGVNALMLVGLTAQESGWGTSRRAKEDNNLSGFEVYNDSSEGARFDSKEESIMITAKLLSNNYLALEGKYYGGKDIFTVNETYCPVNGHDWANNIINITTNLKMEINSL